MYGLGFNVNLNRQALTTVPLGSKLFQVKANKSFFLIDLKELIIALEYFGLILTFGRKGKMS